MYTSLIMPPSINICSFSSNIACQVLVVLQPLLYFVFSDNDEYQYTSTTISTQIKKFDLSSVDTFCNHSSINIDVPIKKILCKPRFSQTSVKILPVVVWDMFSSLLSHAHLYISPIHSFLITGIVLCTIIPLYERLSSKAL